MAVAKGRLWFEGRPGGGAVIFVRQDPTDNSPIVDRVFLSAQDWTDVQNEVSAPSGTEPTNPVDPGV